MGPTLHIQEPSWSAALHHFMQKTDWKKLEQCVEENYSLHTCYPPREKIFRAFELTPLRAIKVVILGQDPYHGLGQANGLAFSVEMGQKLPPSLRNILKEALRDTAGMPIPDLSRWAEQGVFLLNTVLTVEEKRPGSHNYFGWESFTDEVISLISEQLENVVFMLWGQYAQKKEPLIDGKRHLILKAPHPSPLSAYQGFLGCGHFSEANQFLMSKGMRQINW